MPGLVRMPDVAFVSWKQLPDRKCPNEPIASLFPELAVEVSERSNTRGEMKRKLKEYFLAGTQLVWMVDPNTRVSWTCHTAPDRFVCLHEGDVLDGGRPPAGLPVAAWSNCSRGSQKPQQRRRRRPKRRDQ